MTSTLDLRYDSHDYLASFDFSPADESVNAGATLEIWEVKDVCDRDCHAPLNQDGLDALCNSDDFNQACLDQLSENDNQAKSDAADAANERRRERQEELRLGE